jgi:hypothetical protein
MVFDILRIHEIGQSLGLSRNEINRVMTSGNKGLTTFWKVIIIVLASIIGIIMIAILIDNIYPANALYSTVRIKDFRKKKKELI